MMAAQSFESDGASRKLGEMQTSVLMRGRERCTGEPEICKRVCRLEM